MRSDPTADKISKLMSHLLDELDSAVRNEEAAPFDPEVVRTLERLAKIHVTLQEEPKDSQDSPPVTLTAVL